MKPPELLSAMAIINNQTFMWRFLPSERRRTIMHVAATALDGRFPFDVSHFEWIADDIDKTCRQYEDAQYDRNTATQAQEGFTRRRQNR